MKNRAEEILLEEEKQNNFHYESDGSHSYSRKLVSNANQNSAPKIRETDDLIEFKDSELENSEPEKEDDNEIMFLKMDKSQIADGISDLTPARRKSSNDPFDNERDYVKIDSGELDFNVDQKHRNENNEFSRFFNLENKGLESKSKEPDLYFYEKQINKNEKLPKQIQISKEKLSEDYERQLELEIQKEIDQDKEQNLNFNTNKISQSDESNYHTFSKDKENSNQSYKKDLQKLDSNKNRKDIHKKKVSTIKFLQESSSDNHSENEVLQEDFNQENPFEINLDRSKAKQCNSPTNLKKQNNNFAEEDEYQHKSNYKRMGHSDISAGMGIQITEPDATSGFESNRIFKLNSGSKNALFNVDSKRQQERVKMFSKANNN